MAKLTVSSNGNPEIVSLVQHTGLGALSARRQRPRLPVQSYNNTEWEANRAIITHLYSVERQPLGEVRRRLRQMGFQVK
ncbi:hypothetical protein A1O1_06894 [Capronia coronata CBS 617.96]|uniref:Clr5 domain-containing protein n=1 Tax=Capronia coronata CBS 617.96 TaxID=1182541 RepID=W9Y0V4_9EURO|nr:uncharacterized protein A1O1_06894 [Capronia coronata CBS 617.96]EXJ83275.1 hypothetical protein A1O1_06894 [Capronia coronata CBS 617.96]